VRCIHVSCYTWVLCSVATAVTCCAPFPRVRLHLGVVFSCHCGRVLCAVSTCLVTPGCCVQLPMLSRVVRCLHVSCYTWVLCSVTTAVTCCALFPRVRLHLGVAFSCHRFYLNRPSWLRPRILVSRNWRLAFWVETPCRLVAGYRRLGGTCGQDLRIRASLYTRGKCLA